MKRIKLDFATVGLIFLGVLNFLPFLAPLLLHWGLDALAKPIYLLYSFTCHQMDTRSLHIHDHQGAWCSRCMGMWGGIFVGAFLVKVLRLKPPRWFLLLPFMLPMALDGSIQTIATMFSYQGNQALYISTNFMRWLTGSLFGLALGMGGMGAILDSEDVALRPRVRGLNFYGWIGSAFVGLMLVYLALVQIWSASSPAVQPNNFLDSGIRASEDKDAILTRRATAVCPAALTAGTASPTELFQLDCFLGR